jgi:peptide/nickel transport system permease protein
VSGVTSVPAPSGLRIKRPTAVRLPLPKAMRGKPALLTGTFLLAVIAVLCLGAPLFTSSSPTAVDALHPLAAPFSSGHLLGTDEYGRDMLSRVLYGGRYDLAIAFGATAVTLVFGTAVGLLSGYVGKTTDRIVMRIVDLFFAFPFVVLVIAIIAALGPSLINLFIALWVTSWVSYARISHGQTLSAKGYGYVVAARCLGYSPLRIMFRHVLPSIVPLVTIFAMVDAVGNVLLGASLGFLGVGIRQPAPEWGSMISDGQSYILSNLSLSLIPGLALVLLGVALSLIGDGLNDLLRRAQ